MKITVIGGGIFGCTIAAELNKTHDVVLLEKKSDLMLEASLGNQNRIHYGYHYPRSLGTARQSLDGLLSYMMYYPGSVVANFQNYYAIANKGSFTTREDFEKFCDDAGIYYKEDYPDAKFLNREKLASCYSVREPIFDYSILKKEVIENLKSSGVKPLLDTFIVKQEKLKDGYVVVLNTGESYHTDKVINATYAGINTVNKQFDVTPRELRFEHAILPIFKCKDIPKIGITIMDGAYCSVIPHAGHKDQWLLSHVDGTVFSNSNDINNLRVPKDKEEEYVACERIYELSEEWCPFLKDVERNGCFSVAKTVEENKYDARKSVIATTTDSPNFCTVLGGKISTCVKIAYELRDIFDNRENAGGVLV